MRIVIIAPDLNGRSGWSRYAADLGRAFVAQGHMVEAVVWKRSAEPFCTEHALLPSPMGALTSSLLRKIAAWRLKRALRAIKPDVVHFMAEPYALLLPLLGAHSWRSVMTIHGSYAVIPLATTGATAKAARDTYASVDRIIAVSNFTQGYLEEHFSKLYEELDLDAKIHVVPNGVQTSQETTHAKAKDGIKRIVGVGAVKNRKGFLEAVDACAEYSKIASTPFRYEIIGTLEEDPGYATRVRERIALHGLTDRIFLRGSVNEEELSAEYANADLYLMLSLHEGYHVEGFGIVFLEANARGIPVIGPNTGGCVEAIADGRSGYVCDPKDAKAVAAKMKLILEDASIDSEECRKWAEEHDIEDIAISVLKLYGKKR